MTVRLLLVDDEAPARSRLRDVLADIALACPHEIVGEASDAQQALDQIADLEPDIVLLDVQMPGMTGIELASHVAQYLTQPPAIIFISAYDEFALKAFEVRALDYLLKPVRAARLMEAVNRVAALRRSAGSGQSAAQRADMAAISELAMSTAATSGQRRHFAMQQRGRLLLIPVGDVLFLKAEAKYVTVRTISGEFLIEESLLSLEQELARQFVRVHRNALVARAAIAGVEKARPIQADTDNDGERGQETWQVILHGIDERLPISRRQWSTIKALVK